MDPEFDSKSDHADERTPSKLFEESPTQGNTHREQLYQEYLDLLSERQIEADTIRRKFFRPDQNSISAYEESLKYYRDRLRCMLGWPLTEANPLTIPDAKFKHVASHHSIEISRVWIEVGHHLTCYGLFFKNQENTPSPLVVAQHGGNGTPELCSNFFGSKNYNDMVPRIVEKGYSVFAPQLMLWNKEEFGPDHKRWIFDKQLKQTGSSITALELFKLQRSIDYFTSRPDIDSSRIAMTGLSYGGFFTLYLAALDTRIKVSLSSCYVNDRKQYPFDDWVWNDALSQFTDVEVAAMICPRALGIEIGTVDTVFSSNAARPIIQQIERHFATMGKSDSFRIIEHPDGHEFNRSDDGLDFLKKHL